jgi:rod shape-determining protein MreC
MYNSDSTPTTGKIFIGIIISSLIIILSILGVFKDAYMVSASIFKDFQQQNMLFFGRIEQDFKFLNDLGNLRSENEMLKAENQNLKSEKITQQIALDDLTKISKQLTFNSDMNYIPVRITLYSDNQTEIVIDKGSKEGVKENDVLVIDNYLVGVVTEVSENFAKGRLIISKNSKVPSETKKDNMRGVSVGDGISTIVLQQVPNEKSLTIDDYVLTAGLDGVFPYGLIIGKIVKIESKEAEIEQKAQVSTEINLKNLREIFIIKKR